MTLPVIYEIEPHYDLKHISYKWMLSSILSASPKNSDGGTLQFWPMSTCIGCTICSQSFSVPPLRGSV